MSRGLIEAEQVIGSAVVVSSYWPFQTGRRAQAAALDCQWSPRAIEAEVSSPVSELEKEWSWA